MARVRLGEPVPHCLCQSTINDEVGSADPAYRWTGRIATPYATLAAVPMRPVGFKPVTIASAVPVIAARQGIIGFAKAHFGLTA